MAPLVFRALRCDALWGPAAREIATREPKGSEWSISKPARALRTLRRPPHRRRLVANVWLGALARCPARPATAHRHRGRAPVPPTDTAAWPCRRSPVRPASHVKPSSPLLACAPSPVKPTTPLQARYTCFRRNCGEQRRHGFHGDVPMSPHWCRRFHLVAR